MPHTVSPNHITRQSPPPSPSRASVILGGVILILLTGNTIALLANTDFGQAPHPHPNFASVRLPTMAPVRSAPRVVAVHDSEDSGDDTGEGDDAGDTNTTTDEVSAQQIPDDTQNIIAVLTQQRTLLFIATRTADTDWGAYSREVRTCIGTRFTLRTDLTYEAIRDDCVTYYQNDGHE